MPIVKIKNIGAAGIIKDQQADELPIEALSDGLNVRMRDASVVRLPGYQQIFTTPTLVPRSIQIYNTATRRFVVHCATSAVYSEDGSTRTDITGSPLNGSDSIRWTGGVLNGVLVLNNGVDAPQYWGGDPATTLADVPGWNATWKAKVVRPFKNYLVGLDWTKGTDTYPHMVKWSSAADPGFVPSSWDETNPAIDAGEVDLAETPDLMVDALPLGESLIIYKSASMYAMTYIGGQYIWQFRRLPGDFGMLAPGCGVVIPQGHLVMTPGDVVINNGMQAQSVLDGKMRQWLFGQIDQTNYFRAFVVANYSYNEALVCFPTSGSEYCNKALVYNWNDGSCSIRDLPNVTCATSGQFEYSAESTWASDVDTWADDTSTWNQSDIPLAQSRVLMGTAGPKLIGMDLGTSSDGGTFNASIERTGISFDDPQAIKLVRGAYPRIDGEAGKTVYLQFGGAMTVDGSYEWYDPVPYVIGTTIRLDVFATGRFIGWRLYSLVNFNWRIRSMDVDVVVQGVY